MYYEDCTNFIDKKIVLLHDFCILESIDPREDDVRKMLECCSNETQAENLLHDVLVGNTTLDALLGKVVM